MDYTNLNTLWFALVAVLWLGYFFLEGFDFGVGILLPFLGRDDTDRRVLINTIGPVWDGNEVWLLVAGGATFAAFPGWYATLFSGFYLPLFLVLVALIVRNVAFEYRGKHDSQAWRAAWDTAIFVGSLVPALLWGVAWANILHGVPIDKSGNYAGGFFTLLTPYALLGGVLSLGLFTLHGAVFLTLRTGGDMPERTRRVAAALSVPVLAVVGLFLGWTLLFARVHGRGVVPAVVPVLALVAGAAAVALVRLRRDGWAFVATGMTILATFATVFLNLYPRVMPSSMARAFDLTIFNTSSTPYTLGIMTIVALIFTPVVLLYQGWTYHVFRARVSRDRFETKVGSPIDVLAAVLRHEPYAYRGNVSSGPARR
ncbi:MAG TPA: cytochrome d ubiquinol oxidase subunit II [Acidimicrobiales bacterium]|nr:cytochrome d ubiquinol oxidase subunit II [Acidimicrobiales bacterium]